MTLNVAESTRQAYVVMKNEIKKFFSGKRMILFLGIMILMLTLMTALPYLLGGSLSEDPGELSITYISMSSFIVLMASTLFASISIVSEYDERTALIIFTRPMRRVSIFAGKTLASLVVSIGFLALYYIFTAVISLVITGGVNGDLPISLLMSCGYAFGTTGIAMFISSFMKKSSTSTIVTFVILLAIIPVISTAMTLAGVDATWMLDKAAGTITTCSEAYRINYNATIDTLIAMLSDPSQTINIALLVQEFAAQGITVTYDLLYQVLSAPGVLYTEAMAGMMGSMKVVAPDILYNFGVMIAWGLISLIAAFYMFTKREF